MFTVTRYRFNEKLQICLPLAARTLAKYNFLGAFTVASLNTTMSFFFECFIKHALLLYIFDKLCDQDTFLVKFSSVNHPVFILIEKTNLNIILFTIKFKGGLTTKVL